MQIVINMDDETYRHIRATHFYVPDIRNGGKNIVNEMLIAIRSGTPLPKGHGNLIQREDAETLFAKGRAELYAHCKKVQIKDFQTRENMLLNAEQLVHLIKPIIEADKEKKDADSN